MQDASLHLSESSPGPQRFASKIDTWLIAVLLLPALMLAIVVLPGVALDQPALLLAIVVPQILVVWILARTFYIVDNEALLVRSGPFRWTIPLSSIRAVSATRNPVSSPALSLDRIAIHHTGGTLMISPRSRAAFVRAIATRLPLVPITGLPGADGVTTSDPPESSFSVGAIVPAVLVGVVGVAFGSWQFYAGTRPPEAVVSPNTLAISGLYSTTVRRQEVVRMTLEERLTVVRKLEGFGGGRHLRGFYDVAGLGRTRVFISRDTPPYIVLHTSTQPVVIGFGDPARTHALYNELRRAWKLDPPSH
jgi:hypothetical protein